MKLLTRTNIFFIILTLIVFAFSGTVFYKSMRHITREDAIERLSDEENKVISYVAAHQALPNNTITLGDSIAFYPSATPVQEKTEHARFFKQGEHEYEQYQTLEFNISLKGANYRTVIFKPLLESDDMQEAIFEAIGIVSIILLIVLVLANFIISRWAWKPFYVTLTKIRSFDLVKGDKITLGKVSTKEFNELNNALETMANRIAADYRNMKKFTENASHELQTPLSVIQSKIELMVQSDSVSARQMDELQIIYEATGRLSKLNQALLLLAKIENRQFTEIKKVALDELIESKLNVFEELIKHKNISVEKNLGTVFLEIHPVLADIMLSNLIGNAIKHNIDEGLINITLNKNSLMIGNSGHELSMPPNELFQRFRKASDASDSIGLGLAIVKEICDVYGFGIQYTNSGKIHTISVSFS